MDFELSKEQKDIKKAAREFAEGEFPGIAKECDRKEEFPTDVWKKACELGFIGGFIDEEYGGSGLGGLETAIILEEFWRVDPGIGNIMLTTYGAEILQLHGNDNQKRSYLSPLTKGKSIMGIAYTEPEVGSDLRSIETLAKRDKSGYVISGKKIFITNASLADYTIVICLTNPETDALDNRHSAIIVRTDSEGVHIKSFRDKLSIRASDLGEITFKEVRVSQENLIGNEGDGFSQLTEFLDRARIYTAAQGVGVAQGALEKSIQYVKEREIFGHPVGWYQITQIKIAEMVTMIEAARSLCYHAAWKMDQGQVDRRLISMAKCLSAEVAESVTGEAIQLHGGYGFTKDLDLERFYRDAQTIGICGGTRDVEKIMLARSILGKL